MRVLHRMRKRVEQSKEQTKEVPDQIAGAGVEDAFKRLFGTDFKLNGARESQIKKMTPGFQPAEG